MCTHLKWLLGKEMRYEMFPTQIAQSHTAPQSPVHMTNMKEDEINHYAWLSLHTVFWHSVLAVCKTLRHCRWRSV